MSLANGLSILFILSKNQLLALLIFAMVSFISFAFISALIFKISFLLLTLGFFISSFASCFMCLSKLWEMVKDREARHAAIHGSPRVRHDLATEQQQQQNSVC